MSPLGAILLLWLAVSLTVYGYRLYRRVTQGPKTARDAWSSADTGRAGYLARGDLARGDLARGDLIPDNLTPDKLGPATRLIRNPVAGFDPGPTSPTPPAGDISPPAAPPVAPAVDPSAEVPISPQDAPPAVAARSRPPATANPTSSLAPGDLPAHERRVARVPVAEAVAGIRMPCDLAPLLGDAVRVDPFDVAFFTLTVDGDHVRDALAAELLRLGFGVATPSSHRIVASRTGAELVVTVFPDPDRATEGGRSLFPTAGTGSVVARFQS